MHDLLSEDLENRWLGESADVGRLAAQVVNVLAAKTSAPTQIRQGFLDRLVGAAAFGDAQAVESLVDEMLRSRIGGRAIVDLYIPEAARRLGCDWVEDRRGFAEVTIGSSILQSLVRDLSRGWSADRADVIHTASVLVAVPDGEDHTLGAVVATSWLRRHGVSVCLRLQPTERDLCALAAKAGFDAVLLSLANVEKLAVAGKLVEKLRIAMPGGTPILVGGSVIGRADGIARLTGADVATNDLDEVMRVVGNSSAFTAVFAGAVPSSEAAIRGGEGA